MTPRPRADAESDDSLLSAPRSLNEFVTCRFSYLTITEAPVSAESLGAGSNGVCSTWPAMVRRAASMSDIVTFMAQAPHHRQASRKAGGHPLASRRCILHLPHAIEEGYLAMT